MEWPQCQAKRHLLAKMVPIILWILTSLRIKETALPNAQPVEIRPNAETKGIAQVTEVEAVSVVHQVCPRVEDNANERVVLAEGIEIVKEGSEEETSGAQTEMLVCNECLRAEGLLVNS